MTLHFEWLFRNTKLQIGDSATLKKIDHNN